MNNSLAPDSDSRLDHALHRIPLDAQCVVEGGHLTVRIEHMRGLHDRQLRGQKDGCYLAVVTDHPDALPGEILRGASKEDGPIEWVVILPEIGQVIDLPARSMGVGDVYTITYGPSETQQRSLRVALDFARQLSTRVKRVRLAILIGDLDIPPALRHHNLEWLLPESYKAMLDEAGLRSEVHLYSEAACRNQGKRRLLDPRKKNFEKRDTAEQIYKEHGYTLFQDFRYGSFNLCSDYALQKLSEFPYLVAVTKDAKTCTCGLILAGKLFSISKEGFTHFISIYDEADDARIRRKNIDGFLIFSYLVPERCVDAILCTSNTVGRLEQQPKVDEISSDQIRKPGALSGLQELLELTRKKNLVPGLGFVDVMSPGACCSPEGTLCQLIDGRRL